MRNIVVFKAADNMYYSVHFTYMAQKFISETLALACAFNKSRDVHKFNGSGRKLVRLIHFGEFIKSFIRYAHHAHIRLYRAERVVRALSARIGYGIKKRAFSHVRKPDYTKLHILFSFYIN